MASGAASRNDVRVRAFGPDLAPLGPPTALPGAADGVAALDVAGVPMLAFGTRDGGPIFVATLQAPELPPVELAITGAPILAALGEQLLVVGRSPAGGTAWQLVDPAGQGPSAAKAFDGTSEVPDSAGAIRGAAVIRYPGSGHCLLLDAAAEAIGSFVCEPDRRGFIASDGETARLVYVTTVRGAEYHMVQPLLGAGAYEPTAIGLVAAPQRLDSAPDTLSAAGGSRPTLQVATEDNPDGLVSLAFAETNQLFRGHGRAQWRDVGVRAVARRDDAALLVSFGYGDDPRVTAEPVTEHVFENAPYSLVPLVDVGPGCVPTAESCNADPGPPRDDDCDGTPENGLCCSQSVLRWRQAFTPVAPIEKFAMDDMPDRNAYLLGAQHSNGEIRGYVIDFANASNEISNDPLTTGIFDMLERPFARNQAPWDLSEAHDLVGFSVLHGYRGLIAHNALGQLAAWWKPTGGDWPTPDPNFRWQAPSVLAGCEEVLAYDSVTRPNPEDIGRVPAGWVGMIIVCPTTLFRYSPRIDAYEPNFEL